MDILLAKTFFMWCSILGFGLMLFWSACVFFMPDFVFKLQSYFMTLERKPYDLAMYCFLGAFKFATIVFFLIPYVALEIIS